MMKKFKKVLSLLLVFVMTLTMLPTSALAVVADLEESAGANTGKYIEGMPAGDRELAESLRENYPQQAGDVAGGDVTISQAGGLTITENKNPAVTLDKGNTDEAAISYYAEDEIVRVIVVLEGEPLLDQGFTTEEIAANDGEVEYQVSVMHTMQDALMGDINVLVQNLMPDTYTGKIEAKYNYSITMNGMAVEVPFGVVDEIAELDGVEAAYVAPQYSVPEDMTDTADPSMVTTQTLAGSALTWDLGYTGAGMRIAIIDTGLDIDHPSFVGGVPLTETSLTLAEIEGVLEDLNAYKQYAGLTAKALYNSDKIPFRFNYVDQDLDVTHDNDSAGDHGTHVAGIAAANKIDSTDVVGVAPEAQLIAMKVFGKNGGAYWDDIVAALEDCFLLNVDAINMSLGSPSGFTYESDKLSVQFVEIMARIERSDMIASVSAGNSYSAGQGNYWYEFLVDYGLQSYFPELVPGRNQTSDPANGVVSSPATFVGSTVVASLENNTTAAEILVATDGAGNKHTFAFGDNYTYFTYYLGGNGDYQDHEHEYVMIPGVGNPSDYAGLDVKGKIAVVQRGDIAFTDKQTNAADAGAVGCIIYDNVDAALFYMQDAGVIPNISITLADGLMLKELAGEDGVGTLIVRYNNVIIAENALAGTMSDFSSWGVTPDLRLVPDVTSYGGNIYSTYTDGQYGIMSGTSMSAPHIAGMAALVLQYLRDSGYEVLASEADYHLIAEALLMSTATPVMEPSGVLYSPRKQGAGNANIYSAITSPVYLTANGGEPSVSFGDDDYRTGEYTFSFELNNLTGEAQTYVLDATVLTDQFHEAFAELTSQIYPGGIYLMGETSRELDAAVVFEYVNTAAGQYCDYNGDGLMNIDDVEDFLYDVNYERTTYKAANDLHADGVLDTADVQALYKMLSAVPNSKVNQITVPAYGSTKVAVTVTLSDEDMAYMDTYYENGIYVEGFVRCYAENSDNSDLSLPFMGFYGDWSAARVFDTYSWYHEGENGPQLAERYASILWVDSTTGIGAGGNPYAASLAAYDPDYEPEIYAPTVSPNGDGSYDYVDDIYLSLMRNAKLIEFTWTDQDGNILDQRGAEYARQSSYQSGYGSIIPFVYSWWFEDIYGFIDDEGNYLPNGSEVTLTVDFYLDDGDWVKDDSTSATIQVDSVYPEISDFEYVYDEETDERKLVITVEDDRDVAVVAMMTRAGSIVEMIKPETVATADGVSGTYTFDASEMDNSFVLVVGDYAGNERYYDIEFGGSDSVRGNAFYAYRNLMNYNPGNGYIYIMDGYNGWHSFLSNDAVDSLWMHTSMYADNETIVVAADYVDGYVIGIDSANQIFAMKAGDWTRIPFGTFEIDGEAYTVLDMAYDFKNEVMYVLTDEQAAGLGGHLATIDVLTGEVTDLGVIKFAAGEDVQALTLACDNDGVLYTISYVAGAQEGNKDTGDLYTINPATLSTTYVGETGYLPDYRQSMTVDHGTNKLYWLAYGNPYSTDPYYADDSDEDAEESGPATFFEVNKATGKLTEVSDVQYDSQMTALYKPYRKDIGVIPAAELERIDLNKTSYLMGAGVTFALKALPYPYYAELGEIEWTTSDPTVATVDENGTVLAVGEGTAVITARSGSITATCEVKVSRNSSELTFFDMGNMYAWASFNAGAPADMAYVTEELWVGYIAAAYYDGWVYAADYNGALSRLDPETLAGTQIGVTNKIIIGMAFNYADGFMYGIAQGGNMIESYYELIRINPNTGEAVSVARLDSSYTPATGLAIDYEGNFYSICHKSDGWYDYLGQFLVKWTLDENDEIVVTGEYVNEHLVEQSSSMVYSERDKGIYFFNSYGQIFWIDTENLPANGETFAVSDLGYVGDFEDYSYAQNMALFTVPDVEPELPYVPAEEVILPDSYILLEGGVIGNGITLMPWNASADMTFGMEDPDIAYVDANGNIVGLSVGTTTLEITVAGETFVREVTVCESTGALGGYLLDDFSGGGNAFISFSDTNPSEETSVNGYSEDWTVLSGAYFDGTLYAYAQDYWGDLGYYYYFLAIDAYTHEVEVLSRVAYTLRDMAFDYTTGNMYAIAQGGELTGAVVQMDLETGEMTIIGETGVSFAAMTIDARGQMYGIGEDDYLYRIDKYDATAERIGHTGSDAGKVFQSMHYDLDTGNVYWAQVNESYVSSLRLVDLQTGVTSSLGPISPYGCEVVMLYTIPENEPTEPVGEPEVAGISVTEVATTYVKGTVQLEAQILTEVELEAPAGGDASANAIGGTPDVTIDWHSSDTNIATVDENGLVTGVAPGVVTITAKVGEYSDTCEVTITATERKFYAYDKGNTRWISFEADDPYTITVEREDAEGETALQASTYIQELDIIYAIDTNGDVYTIDPETFDRTALGGSVGNTTTIVYSGTDWWGEEYTEEVECELRVVDMSYDNGMLYVAMYANDAYEDTYLVTICELDLTTGEVVEVLYELNPYTEYERPIALPVGLLVLNGRAYTVDAYWSGIINHVDLYSEDPEFVQDTLIKIYWGEMDASIGLFRDELTGTVYGLRDNTDTVSGEYNDDYTAFERYWDGVTGDAVLYILGLSDGSTVEIGKIGAGLLIRGIFIR